MGSCNVCGVLGCIGPCFIDGFGRRVFKPFVPVLLLLSSYGVVVGVTESFGVELIGNGGVAFVGSILCRLVSAVQ